jgi:hypothetical protein
VIQPTHEQVGSLVPVDRTEDKPQLEIGETFKAAILRLFSKCEKLDEAQWLRVKQGMIRARNYYDGKQFGAVNNSCQWFDYPTSSGEEHYTANVYQLHVQTALIEISKGRTQLSFAHVNPDARYGRDVAKIAEQLNKQHRQRLFTAIKEQQENLSSLLNGLAARYTYFDHSKSKDKMPVFGDRDVEASSAQVCAVCGAPSEGMCKVCGSDEVKPVQQDAYKAKVVSGYKDQYCGENKWDAVDPIGLLFHFNAQSVEDTPYLIWKQVVLKEVLQSQYPGSKIVEGVMAPELTDQAGSQSNTPNTNFGLTGDSDKATSQLDQGWFDLPLYANIPIKEKVVLRNGVIIMPGMTLGQIFPNGLYISKNGETILDIWSESKNDKWTIAPYVLRLGTMIGAGTSAALEAQDIKNDLLNLYMASTMNDAFRKEFVNGMYLEAENIPNNPYERAVVTNLPEGQRIVGSAIDVLPPSGLSPDAFALDEKADGLMQGQIGSFSGTPLGMPDIKSVQNTAAGMAMWREQTTNRFWPMLSVRADALDRRQALQFLKNDQRYLTPKQCEKIKGDYGSDAVKAFLSCDLENDLIIEVVEGSYIAVPESVKKADAIEYSTIVANLSGAGITPDSELGSYIAQSFKVPKDLVSFDKFYAMAEDMVAKMKAHADPVVQAYGDIPNANVQLDPVALEMATLILKQSQIDVNPIMDDANSMVAALRDWWVKDEGRQASNLMKASVTLLVMGLEAGGVQKVQRDLMLAMQAQQPAVEAEQQMAAQQAEAEGASTQAQAEAEAQNLEAQRVAQEEAMMGEATNKVIDAEQSEAADMRAAEEAEKQRAHELMMADKTELSSQAQREHDAKMAKQKPKQAA